MVLKTVPIQRRTRKRIALLGHFTGAFLARVNTVVKYSEAALSMMVWIVIQERE